MSGGRSSQIVDLTQKLRERPTPKFYRRGASCAGLIASGGVLKQYFRELEQEPDDLIGQEESGEPDEGDLYFEWKRDVKKYKLVH